MKTFSQSPAQVMAATVKATLFSVALLASAAASAVVAPTTSYTGAVTVDDPTWQRPVAMSNSLSGVGTNVGYDAQLFSVSAGGSYTFTSLGTVPVRWDNYTFLYQTAFDPTMQFVNRIAGNDDKGFIGSSGFDATLAAGMDYFFITTGFANRDRGMYVNSITGNGIVTLRSQATAVPEPAPLALLGIALTAMLLAKRRKSS